MLGVALLAAAAAATPIPQLKDPTVPTYVGHPATQHALRAAPPPRNPFMAPNGSSLLHEDGWQTDASFRAGPLGRNVRVTSTYYNRDCASVTFDAHGRIVTVCVGLDHPVLELLDPHTLDEIAHLNLPPREPAPGSPFQNFAGGGYFYLDNRDHAIVPTGNRHILDVTVGASGFSVVRDVDLSGAIPFGDGIVSALPDWKGRLWVATRDGRFGTVDMATGAPHLVQLEPIGNSFAAAESGDVYVVTNAALYRFRAGSDGVPHPVWRRTYDNIGTQKPGQSQPGSGTTPTLTARRLVGITDNADPMKVVIFTRAGRRVCSVPVFGLHAGSTDQSLVAENRSFVTENNYGYTGPQATLEGRTTTPGLERIDVSRHLRSCRVRWISHEIAPTVVPKVSVPNGLVYTYTKPAGSRQDPWYLTALDFRTGATVYKALAGFGLGFNNNYAPITIGPDGTAYVGTLGGLVALRDATPPPQPAGPPRPHLRLVARCHRRPRLRGDTDWVMHVRLRRHHRRWKARIRLTDGRLVHRHVRARRC